MPLHRVIRLFVSSCALLTSALCLAAPQELAVSLPLGPHYRPGKYVAVRLKADFPDEAEHWAAVTAANVKGREDVSRGAGRTSVKVGQGRLDVTVPWLVMERYARHPKLVIDGRSESAEGPPLQELRENQRLIGSTVVVDPAFARTLVAKGLMGEVEIIPVALDPAQPIKGHACAYEVLDAVVLDESAAARLRPEDIPDLLASGVTVAIRTARPPLPEWPWTRVGEFAVLRHEVAGPETAGYHEAAYAPVAGWQSGWPWAFRRRVLVVGAVCCVLILALALWRPRWSAVWAVVLIAGMVTAIGQWWGGRVPVQQAAGEIVVMPAPGAAGGLTQTDAWTYQTASVDRFATLKWSGVARPVFASDAGVNDVWVSLNCDMDGRPQEFGVRIPKDRKVAFCSRSVGLGSPQAPAQIPVTSPLKPLADALYGSRLIEVKGQVPSAAASEPAYEQWNAVILHRRGLP